MKKPKDNTPPIQLRRLIEGELEPTRKGADRPFCEFGFHPASYEASEPMRAEWLTCLRCAELGRRPRKSTA